MENFKLKNYKTDDFYDEMFDANGQIRQGYEVFEKEVENLSLTEMITRQNAAERSLMAMGITFNVYSESKGTERIMPVDIIPRIVNKPEWDYLESGLKQRIQALNLFIDDIYHNQKIIKDGIVPRDLIESCKCYLEVCKGLNPPKNIWIHITGTDLIRGNDGQYMVLEDNLRCPSGVSYMLENRELIKRTFPEIFHKSNVRPVSDYPTRLLEMLQFITQ